MLGICEFFTDSIYKIFKKLVNFHLTNLSIMIKMKEIHTTIGE
jgi:hypothetical protein